MIECLPASWRPMGLSPPVKSTMDSCEDFRTPLIPGWGRQGGRLPVQGQPATGCVLIQSMCTVYSRLACKREIKSPGFSSQIFSVQHLLVQHSYPFPLVFAQVSTTTPNCPLKLVPCPTCVQQHNQSPLCQQSFLIFMLLTNLQIWAELARGVAHLCSFSY